MAEAFRWRVFSRPPPGWGGDWPLWDTGRWKHWKASFGGGPRTAPAATSSTILRSTRCRLGFGESIVPQQKAIPQIPCWEATSTCISAPALSSPSDSSRPAANTLLETKMIRLLFRLLPPLAFAATLMAADVSVRVTDHRAATVPGAIVSLIARDGERRVLTTDAAGKCRFTNLPAGQYFLEGAAAGFDTSAARPLDIKGEGGELTIDLALGIAQVHTSVVVTASGTTQTTDEVSKALTVVSADTISQRVDKSLGEALSDVAGLRVQQLGGPGSTTYFKVRGLRNADTAVLVDGLRLRDAAGTQADASGVLQDLVVTNTSQIEVLRGTGSSLYGTDATGGVVNIITDEGGGRTRGSVSFDGGSPGSFRGTAHLAGGFFRDR